MRRLVILCLVSIGLLSGCVTQRRCFNKFPPQVGVHDTVIYRDTVYFFRTITDTVYKTGTIWDT